MLCLHVLVCLYQKPSFLSLSLSIYIYIYVYVSLTTVSEFVIIVLISKTLWDSILRGMQPSCILADKL